MLNNKIEQLMIKSSVRGVARIMVIIPIILLASVFILVGVLLAYSPGKPVPFLDENGKVKR